MYLGRYALGEVVVVPLLARNAARTPAKSTAAPTYAIYNSTGTSVATGSFSLWDSLRTTGLYRLVLRLSSTFSAGSYDIVVNYAISGVTIVQIFRLVVVAGGDADGMVLSLGRLDATNRWLLGQKGSGKLDAYRNARSP
jgi:hypothetical protein